jgi:diguanylate cyclase (GGDEF)-like protein
MKMNDVQSNEGVSAPQADMAMSHEQLALLCADLRQQNARLSARVRVLEDEICRDTLTPLFNRRHFEQAVALSIAHCQRYGTRSALLFIDVDDLKSINDTYGHAAGDEALRIVADVLLANVRSTDVVARIGGDEFALLLGAISDDDVEQKIAQLTAGIGASRPDFAGGEACLSATFGHAFIHPDDLACKVLARADSQMYRSKRSRGAALR